MKRFLFLTLMLFVSHGVANVADSDDSHTISGIIYFTNNKPDNVDEFPVELYMRDEETLVAATKPVESNFKLDGIKPGKYLLKLTWPNRCTLWYKVDLRQESKQRISVVMDAACAHHDGCIRDLPSN